MLGAIDSESLLTRSPEDEGEAELEVGEGVMLSGVEDCPLEAVEKSDSGGKLELTGGES